MRAAVFHAARDIRIEDVPEPPAPGPHEVLVTPTCCGICGTDLHEYVDGPHVIPVEPHPLTGAQAPQILGHEFAGEVVAVGREVTHVIEGDRVAVMPVHFCGHCPACLRGDQHLCARFACTGLMDHWGGLAELTLLPGYQVARLPERVSDAQGALVEPAAVVIKAVERSGVRAGETLHIAGAGPIGALSALYAHAIGVDDVVVSEPNARRRAFVESLGVATVVDPATTDVTELLRERTQGAGGDAALECAGHPRALDAAVSGTRAGGTVVQVGLHTAPAPVDPMRVASQEIRVVGTWCYPVYDWPRVIRVIASGRFPVERLVTATIGMDDVVPRGFEALLDPAGDDVKVMIEPLAG